MNLFKIEKVEGYFNITINFNDIKKYKVKYDAKSFDFSGVYEKGGDSGDGFCYDFKQSSIEIYINGEFLYDFQTETDYKYYKKHNIIKIKITCHNEEDIDALNKCYYNQKLINKIDNF
jgi:hypothetical protein